MRDYVGDLHVRDHSLQLPKTKDLLRGGGGALHKDYRISGFLVGFRKLLQTTISTYGQGLRTLQESDVASSRSSESFTDTDRHCHVDILGVLSHVQTADSAQFQK